MVSAVVARDRGRAAQPLPLSRHRDTIQGLVAAILTTTPYCSGMHTVVLVGNPRANSRTRHAAALLVDQLTGRAPDDVVELADIGAGLLDARDAALVDAKTRVLAADLLVVASPTYKTTYTGLLKLFLDQFAAGELKGTVTVPLMLGAGLRHALAPELTLRPVLVEIGCSCPAPGLFLLDTEYEGSADMSAWLEFSRVPVLRGIDDGRQ